jgi:hypothetical protein
MTIKGFRSSKRLKKVIPNLEVQKTEDFELYTTLNALPSDRVGLDVIAHGVYNVTGALPVTPAAGSDLRKIIFPSAHNAQVGDVIKFVTNQTEAPILSVIDSVTVILGCELGFDPTTDTLKVWRYTTPAYDKDGGLVTSTGPVQFVRNTVTTTVNLDTTTLTNSRPLPTEAIDSVGKRLTYTASNEIPVFDNTVSNKLPATLGSKADAASLAVTQSTEDKAIQGALTETAPATDTASSGLNGRLQRIAQRLTSLIAQLPATLGQKTMANSLAVTIASDQSAVLTKSGNTQVSGSIAATGSIIASTNASDLTHLTLQMIGTWVGTVNIQVSNDNTNWTNTLTVPIGNTSSTPTANITANGIYFACVEGAFFRVQCTAYTSGTIQGYVDASDGSTHDINAKYVSILGTTAVSSTTLALDTTVQTTNTEIGALTETAPATDTASSGLNGRMQRVAQRLTSLIAQFPTTLGVTTKAASLSVAIATDQATQTAPLIIREGDGTNFLSSIALTAAQLTSGALTAIRMGATICMGWDGTTHRELAVDTTGNQKMVAQTTTGTITQVRLTVGTSAVRATVAGTAPNAARKKIMIKPNKNNTGTIYLGSSAVTTATGLEFIGPDRLEFSFDASDYYLISDTAAQTVEILEIV